MVPLARQKPQTRVHAANSISIGSAVFAVLPNTDGSIVFARLRQCEPPCNTCFLGPTRLHIANGILIDSAVFAQLTAECPCTYCPFRWGIGAPSKTWFLGLTPSHPIPQPKRHIDRLSRFCRAHYCDRPT